LQKEKPELLTAEAKSKHEEKLKTSSENLLETMEDLLLWSKSQMQHFTPEYRQVKVADVVAREINIIHPLADERNIRITQNVPGQFIQNTDENFLSVIVRNLLQNAIKYGDEASAVDVSLNKTGIAITNQSTKVKATELNDLLYAKQIDSKRSGLGLQIVNDLARSINTRISFGQRDDDHISAVLEWNA
jgi:signal transduction histidine kinase